MCIITILLFSSLVIIIHQFILYWPQIILFLIYIHFYLSVEVLKKKKRFLFLWKDYSVGIKLQHCLWRGLHFPACFKSWASDYNGTLNGFVMRSRLCDFDAGLLSLGILAWSDRDSSIRQIYVQRLVQSHLKSLSTTTCREPSQSSGELWLHVDEVGWKRYSCNITCKCGPTWGGGGGFTWWVLYDEKKFSEKKPPDTQDFWALFGVNVHVFPTALSLYLKESHVTGAQK